MKCVSGAEAQYICVNRYCDLGNSFICSQPSDRCKNNHESCALLSLSYIMKKAQTQSVNSSRFDALMVLQDKLKEMINSIGEVLSSALLLREINKIISQSSPLTIDDKDRINRFANDRQQNFDSEAAFIKL